MEYILGDPHFFHKLMVKTRGYENRDIMNIDIINKINNIVHNKYDTLIFNGDISFSNKKETKRIISQINGYKILIMGNHDYRHSKKWWHDVGFNDVIDGSLLKDNIIISHIPIENIPEGFYNIHAHTHSNIDKFTDSKFHFCTSFEMIKKPLTLEEIKIKKFKLEIKKIKKV